MNNTVKKYDPMNGIDWDNVECEAHEVAIESTHLEDPYSQKTIIGPSVVTGEVRSRASRNKTPWPNMEI